MEKPNTALYKFPGADFAKMMSEYDQQWEKSTSPYGLSTDTFNPRERAFAAHRIYNRIIEHYDKVLTEILLKVPSPDKDSIYVLAELLKIREEVQEIHKKIFE